MYWASICGSDGVIAVYLMVFVEVVSDSNDLAFDEPDAKAREPTSGSGMPDPADVVTLFVEDVESEFPISA
jgi:hypothetical protein